LAKCRNYIREKKRLYSVTTYSVNKYGEAQIYECDDQRIYVLAHIYNFLKAFYDIRNEYEKDIWDLSKITSNHRGRERYLNFIGFKGYWLFHAVRLYIKYQLATNKAGNTCYNKLLYIRKFHEFLLERYPEITPQEVNRNVIIDYLNFIQSLNTSYIDKHHRLSYLKDFLELCHREKWLDIPSGQIIYVDDFPKNKREIKPNYIPDEIVKKIYHHIDKVSSPIYGRMFLIQMQIGCRVGDLCHLEYGCLTQTSNRQYILQYQNSKQSKWHTIPANDDLVNLIRIQQEQVRKELGSEYQYLFPSRRVKTKDKSKPVSPNAYSRAIKKLIYDNDIRDNNGKLWVFTSHQCRHTVATSMINDGVPAHIVQRYIGHESPTMTQVYAHIHDETLRREIEKYHETRVVNFQGETAELEETVLSSGNDLEWFKKTVQARALEHGYCARPKLLGDCDIPGFDGCYNCPHWRTNKNFLPVLKDTLQRTESVLNKAQNCGWELQVKKNEPVKANLEKVIKSLEAAS
jgi:integrase